MTRHVMIVSDRQKNNVSVYSEEPAVVVTADREDMNSLRVLEEANHAGVYILIGENRRYVGQASGKVYDRLVQHDKAKKWWTKVIFFGREDGHLDKSQTDYLEKELIQLFQQTDFRLDNGTVGNKGYIDKLSRIKADEVWYKAQEILEEVANIDLFESSDATEVEKEVESAKGMRQKNFVIHDITNDKVFTAKSARANFIDFISFYYNDERYHEKLARLTVQDKPTFGNVLGIKPNINSTGRNYTVEIVPNVFLYVNFGTKHRRKALEKIAEQIGVILAVEW